MPTFGERGLNGVIAGMAVILAFVDGVVALAAQAPAPRTFDVASIKPSPDPSNISIKVISGEAQPGGTWRASFATPMPQLRTLYPDFASPGQIVSVPAWAATETFEIVAKTDPSRTPAEMRDMARTLLAERFGFYVPHRTPRGAGLFPDPRPKRWEVGVRVAPAGDRLRRVSRCAREGGTHPCGIGRIWCL